MKVLQFIPSLNAYDGGTTTYMQELAPALGKLVELHVCALGNIADCVKLENASVHTIELSMKHICRMRRQWMALLDEVKPDIVHINCCWLPQCALVQYWTRQWNKGKQPKIPVFLTPHGMLEPWIVRRNYWTKKVPAILLYQRWAIKNADVIVSTAEEEQKHIEELGWNKNIVMFPNGINTKAVKMKTQWKNTGNILFMSRLHPKKGIEMLIEALADVGGLNLKIAGDGEPEYVNSLKILVEKRGMHNRVSFIGPVYAEKKWEEIRATDVVVLPSYSENFGLIVAEALASGTPVVTTIGTPWKSIEENCCGWWVNPTVSDIRKTLIEIAATDKVSLMAMGKRGRRLIETKFDVISLAQTMKDAYSRKTRKC